MNYLSYAADLLSALAPYASDALPALVVPLIFMW